MASKSQSTKTSDELASNGESCDRKRKSKDNKSDISKSSTTPSEAGGKKKSNRFRKFREGLGQAVSSVGEAIRPKHKSEEGVAQDQQTQERPGKLRRLWNGLGLLAQGIKFVVTKPHELLYAGLRRLIPSISTGQLNFLLIVLVVLFAWSIRNEIVRLNDNTVDIQRETQEDVKAMREQMTKQHEMQGSISTAVQDALTRLEGMAGATINGAAKVAEKASEFAGGAAKFVGQTYYSFKSWFGGYWNTSSSSVHVNQQPTEPSQQ